MGLFQKQKETLEGRRRPLASDQAANRAAAFSYYARRSDTPTNTGRGQGDGAPDDGRFASGQLLAQNSTKIYAAVVVAAILGIYMLLLSGTPKIVTVTKDTGNYVMQDPGAYAQTAAEVLGRSWLNKNKLTVDTAGVARELKKQYPEIKHADVRLPVLTMQPVIAVEAYRPALILTATNGAAYLVDENGRALLSASQLQADTELKVPTVQDRSGQEVRFGRQVLSGTTVRFIEEVLGIIEASGIKYGTVSLPPASSELDVAINGAPYFVKFNLQGDARLQTGTFLATKARLEKENAIPAVYIDVRVPERSYYR